MGCSSDVAPEYPERDMATDLSEDIRPTEDAELGELTDEGADIVEQVDPYAPPYPYPPGYLCDTAGTFVPESGPERYVIPTGVEPSPGPFKVSDFESEPFFVTALVPPEGVALEPHTAIWTNGDELTLHLTVWMGEDDYPAADANYHFFLNEEPLVSQIDFWDEERTEITGTVHASGFSYPYKVGSFINADIRVGGLVSGAINDLKLVRNYLGKTQGQRVSVTGYTIYHGGFERWEHECFVKTPNASEFAVEMTESERSAASQLADGWPFFHLFMYTEYNLDSVGSLGVNEVYVGDDDRTTVHILGYPALGKVIETSPWSAETIIPILNGVPLEERWHVAFPKVDGYFRNRHNPVWSASFEVDLPPGDAELILVSLSDTFLPRASPDGRVRDDRREFWAPKINRIHFVRELPE